MKVEKRKAGGFVRRVLRAATALTVLAGIALTGCAGIGDDDDDDDDNTGPASLSIAQKTALDGAALGSGVTGEYTLTLKNAQFAIGVGANADITDWFTVKSGDTVLSKDGEIQANDIITELTIKTTEQIKANVTSEAAITVHAIGKKEASGNFTLTLNKTHCNRATALSVDISYAFAASTGAVATVTQTTAFNEDGNYDPATLTDTSAGVLTVAGGRTFKGTIKLDLVDATFAASPAATAFAISDGNDGAFLSFTSVTVASDPAPTASTVYLNVDGTANVSSSVEETALSITIKTAALATGNSADLTAVATDAHYVIEGSFSATLKNAKKLTGITGSGNANLSATSDETYTITLKGTAFTKDDADAYTLSAASVTVSDSDGVLSGVTLSELTINSDTSATFKLAATTVTIGEDKSGSLRITLPAGATTETPNETLTLIGALPYSLTYLQPSAAVTGDLIEFSGTKYSALSETNDKTATITLTNTTFVSDVAASAFTLGDGTLFEVEAVVVDPTDSKKATLTIAGKNVDVEADVSGTISFALAATATASNTALTAAGEVSYKLVYQPISATLTSSTSRTVFIGTEAAAGVTNTYTITLSGDDTDKAKYAATLSPDSFLVFPTTTGVAWSVDSVEPISDTVATVTVKAVPTLTSGALSGSEVELRLKGTATLATTDAEKSFAITNGKVDYKFLYTGGAVTVAAPTAAQMAGAKANTNVVALSGVNLALVGSSGIPADKTTALGYVGTTTTDYFYATKAATASDTTLAICTSATLGINTVLHFYDKVLFADATASDDASTVSITADMDTYVKHVYYGQDFESVSDITTVASSPDTLTLSNTTYATNFTDYGKYLNSSNNSGKGRIANTITTPIGGSDAYTLEFDMSLAAPANGKNVWFALTTSDSSGAVADNDFATNYLLKLTIEGSWNKDTSGLTEEDFEWTLNGTNTTSLTLNESKFYHFVLAVNPSETSPVTLTVTQRTYDSSSASWNVVSTLLTNEPLSANVSNSNYAAGKFGVAHQGGGGDGRYHLCLDNIVSYSE